MRWITPFVLVLCCFAQDARPSAESLQSMRERLRWLLSVTPYTTFYYNSPHGMQPLEPISTVGMEMNSVGDRLANPPQTIWAFRGAESSVQLSSRRPVFYVSQNAALDEVVGRREHDLVIIQFDMKNDCRELFTTGDGIMFTVKRAIPKDHMPDVLTTRIGNGLFTVTPASDLEPGEYLVTFSSEGVGGYDFGIK
jgi:hypothetical protein